VQQENKQTVSDTEQGLSTCSDDTTMLQTKVKKLKTDVASLKEQCIHLQGYMRRSNIKIMGVAGNASGVFSMLVLVRQFSFCFNVYFIAMKLLMFIDGTVSRIDKA
jgi:hypothetical protein